MDREPSMSKQPFLQENHHQVEPVAFSKPKERLYQTWAGKTLFFCDGKFLTGPFDQEEVTGVVMLTFFVLVCLGIYYKQVSRYVVDTAGLWLVVLTNLVFSLLIFIQFRVSVSDPGILPRRETIKSLSKRFVTQVLKLSEEEIDYLLLGPYRELSDAPESSHEHRE